MKKNNQDENLFNTNISEDKNFEIDKIKTTNVNILLNRVRLDKRKTFKKKNYFYNFSYFYSKFFNSFFIFKLKT